MGWLSNPGYRARRYRPTAPTPPSPARPGLITRQGTKLIRDGREFIFTGLNIYNINSDGNFWYNLATGDELDKAFVNIGDGIEIIRGWFGQWLAHPRPGAIDWTYFDHALDTAYRYGKQVVVVLAEQGGAWDDGILKSFESGWYQSGYRTLVSTKRSWWGTYNTMTYRDFALAVVSRYKDHPGVAFWQLVNEPEMKTEDVSLMTQELEDIAVIYLRDFANDLAAAIKQIDPNHLISFGSIGTGQFGMSGARYEIAHSGPNIDLCEMHDYDMHHDTLGNEFTGIELRMRQAARLNKPMFIGEVGIDPNRVGGIDKRAERLRSKITYQRSLGVAGHISWVWCKTDDPGHDEGYDIRPGDPALDVLRSL